MKLFPATPRFASTSVVRRALLAMSTLALLVPAAHAQPWPDKPIRVIVAGGAGSSPDVFARVLADRLTRSLGQSVFVEAKPGGNGSIAGQIVATAKPDGYTLLFSGNSAIVINPLMAKNLPYNQERDFVSVASVCYVPLAIAVPTTSRVNSLQDLIASAKKTPTFFATPGAASLSRLIGESLNERVGTKFTNVAYPSSPPAQTDVIAGRVPVLIDGLGGIAPHHKSGRLKLLAVSNAERFKEFPDVPTIGEIVPGLSVPGINSILAPTGTPEAVLELLNQKVNEILADPAIGERFLSMGGAPAPGSRAELDKILKGQFTDFRRLIEQANIKAD